MFDDCDDFDDLPQAEATLLWSMRVWVIGHIRQQDVSARIAAALRDVGAERAQPFLDGFMVALSRGARRPLEILCLCRTEISADERSFLESVVLIQQDEAAEAHDRLYALLSETAATVALRNAEGLAQHFVLAGIARPWSTAETTKTRVLH